MIDIRPFSLARSRLSWLRAGPLSAAAAFAALLAGAFAGPAAIAQNAPGGKLAITIYNDDKALVEDMRPVALAGGRQTIGFPNVSARIEPETVALTGKAFDIVEQNFDFDLLTPSKMMEKAVGSTVKIVRTNPATGKEVVESAEILSVNDGVVLRIGDRIEVLRDDGLPVRVLFDKIPDNLRAKPTLSVTLDSKEASTRPLTLRYLTSGLSWAADYVAIYDEAAHKLDLQGWVTLTNQSGAAYPNALTQLVAGQTNGEGGPPAYPDYRPRGGVQGVTSAGTGGDEPAGEEFQDYRLYTLPAPTTIAENQTKQVSLIEAKGIDAAKIYRISRAGLGNDERPQNAAVVIAFSNARQSGLGRALPAGAVRFYARDSQSRAQFIGENRIGHTPQGSNVELKIGDAFDVTLQSEILAQQSPEKGVSVSQMRYVARNARGGPVTLSFVLRGLNPEHKVTAASLDPHALDAFAEAFDIAIPAHGETVLTFTLSQGRKIK